MLLACLQQLVKAATHQDLLDLRRLLQPHPISLHTRFRKLEVIRIAASNPRLIRREGTLLRGLRQAALLRHSSPQTHTLEARHLRCRDQHRRA